MFKKMLMLLVVTASFQAFACDEHGLTGFLPENDLKIYPDSKVRNNMTEEKFNAIIDEIDAVYGAIAKENGGKLKWNRDWDNATVNASASRFFGSWKVNMYGGLARHSLVTDDAFALVVCHELGHHLGGAPKVGNFMMKWASNEGQSDYFATLKCFRKVYQGDNNQEIVAKMDVPAYVQDKCAANFTGEADRALCMRSSMAGKSLALLLGSLRNVSDIDFETPDQNIVSRTDNAHPAAQCRLDTYLAGAICDKRENEDVSTKDPLIGTCNRVQGYDDGVRPLCWYQPNA